MPARPADLQALAVPMEHLGLPALQEILPQGLRLPEIPALVAALEALARPALLACSPSARQAHRAP